MDTPGCERAGCRSAQANDCTIVGLVNARLCENCLRDLMRYEKLDRAMVEVRRGKMILDAQHKLLRSGVDIMTDVRLVIYGILLQEAEVRRCVQEWVRTSVAGALVAERMS